MPLTKTGTMLRFQPLSVEKTVLLFPVGNNYIVSPRYHGFYSRAVTLNMTTKYTPEKIGKLIRGSRKDLGVTQKQLAMTSGSGLRFIIELEKGKPTCQLGKVLTVLHTMGITIKMTPPVPENETYLGRYFGR